MQQTIAITNINLFIVVKLPIIKICALLELVIADLAHIIVAVRLPYSHAPIVLYHFSINDYRRFTQ